MKSLFLLFLLSLSFLFLPANADVGGIPDGTYLDKLTRKGKPILPGKTPSEVINFAFIVANGHITSAITTESSKIPNSFPKVSDYIKRKNKDAQFAFDGENLIYSFKIAALYSMSGNSVLFYRRPLKGVAKPIAGSSLIDDKLKAFSNHQELNGSKLCDSSIINIGADGYTITTFETGLTNGSGISIVPLFGKLSNDGTFQTIYSTNINGDTTTITNISIDPDQITINGTKSQEPFTSTFLKTPCN